MPSPIAHIAAGYVVYRIAAPMAGRLPDMQSGAGLLVSAGVLSMLPDADSVLGILTGDFGRYHNNLSHSVFVAALVGLAVAAMAGRAGRDHFAFWFGFAFACYALHVVMDYFTWGRGVMALWPLRPDRFSAPVVLFYGFHWSQGWVSPQHLRTLFTEAPVAAAAVLAARRLAPVPSGG